MTKNEQATFSADKPIRSRAEDRLGRSRFADALATSILEWTGETSLVLGLFGPWGSGKSSLKNMVLEAVRKAPAATQPEILEFSPWQVIAHEQLAASFFGEIGKALGRGDKEQEQKLAAKWEVYTRTLIAARYLVTSVPTFLAGSLLILVVLPFVASFLAVDMIRVVLRTTSVVSAVVYFALRWGSKVTAAISDVFRARSEAAKRTLDQAKKDVADLLKKHRPVLVVLDDVDRLPADGIRLLFQLVKANADLPNLTFLVLCQRDVVERSLADESHGIDGRQFLEKIVQVAFDVPVVERSRLQEMLTDGVTRLLRPESLGRQFDPIRWGNLFPPVFDAYFRSLRDVYRFLPSLGFHAGIFRSGAVPEVNLIDLFVLEALRLFEPDLYHRLPMEKALLTKSRGSYSDGQVTEEERQTARGRLMNGVPENRRENVQEILSRVFPYCGWVFGDAVLTGDTEDRWRRELRACAESVFPRYFQLDIPQGDISQADIAILLTHLDDQAALVSYLQTLSRRGLLIAAIEALGAYRDVIAFKHAEPFLAALCDVGDELPTELESPFRLTPRQSAAHLVYWYLRREKDAKVRSRITQNVIERTTGIWIPGYLIELGSSSNDPEAKLIGADDLPRVHEAVVAKIKKASETDRLARHPTLGALLNMWLNWGSADDVKAWARDFIRSSSGAVPIFLRAFLVHSSSSGFQDRVARVRWSVDLKQIEKFVELTELESAVAKIDTAGLSPDDARILVVFLESLKRREDGVADGSFGWIRDSDNGETI